MSSSKIRQISYFYSNTKEKKADEKTTLFDDGICYDCDIALCFWKMHHGVLFDRRLVLTEVLQIAVSRK